MTGYTNSGNIRNSDSNGNVVTNASMNGTNVCHTFGTRRIAFATINTLRHYQFCHPLQNPNLLYDGLDRRCQIVEKNKWLPLHSTKRFVWCGTRTLHRNSDGSDTVTKQFLNQAEPNYRKPIIIFSGINSATCNRCWTAAVIATPGRNTIRYGNGIQISGDMSADFGFAGMYFHQPVQREPEPDPHRAGDLIFRKMAFQGSRWRKWWIESL